MSDSLDEVFVSPMENLVSGAAAAERCHAVADDTITIIAREVVARLAHRRAAENTNLSLPTTDEVDKFCDALIGANEERAERIVADLIARGSALNTIYLGYIAAAAIRLGERWENDTSTFVEMTVASGRMYSIMRNIRRFIAPPVVVGDRHAFFSAVPGECHTLGVTMAADMFRRRGWQIDTAIGKTHDELVEVIGHSEHSFIGLSASRPTMAAELTHLIVDIRLCKPHAFIMVAGNITELAPNIKDLVDADIIAHDAPSAIMEMEQIRSDLQNSA